MPSMLGHRGLGGRPTPGAALVGKLGFRFFFHLCHSNFVKNLVKDANRTELGQGRLPAGFRQPTWCCLALPGRCRAGRRCTCCCTCRGRAPGTQEKFWPQPNTTRR